MTWFSAINLLDYVKVQQAWACVVVSW